MANDKIVVIEKPFSITAQADNLQPNTKNFGIKRSA
jgi:hypothetical protein